MLLLLLVEDVLPRKCWLTVVLFDVGVNAAVVTSADDVNVKDGIASSAGGIGGRDWCLLVKRVWVLV